MFLRPRRVPWYSADLLKPNKEQKQHLCFAGGEIASRRRRRHRVRRLFTLK